MLKCLPEFSLAEIVRSRDPKKLSECDIVVDVGADFNHATKRYDHHQREFTGTLSSLRPELGSKYNIKLSSAGLIYTYYGENVIRQFAPKDAPITNDDIQIIYKKVYENFVQEIDAIDNGVPMTDTEPRYKIRTDLSTRIRRLNPEWNTDQHIDSNEIFKEAMKVVSQEFEYNVKYLFSCWLPARDLVRRALETRSEVDPSCQILEFTERFPWKDHLFDLEDELGIPHDIYYVIFNDKPNSWRVQAVPVNPTSFITRKPLMPTWWGVRDDLLSEVSGIDGCVFCHSTGFIGGNVTREGAIKMAVASLNFDLMKERGDN